MYTNTTNCVRVNGVLTDTFTSELSLKQGDPASPTHFNAYINDLLQQLKNNGRGVKLETGDTINVLAYADDIVLLAENENDLQSLMDITAEWCFKWRISINPSKSSVVHFRRCTKQMTSKQFKLGVHELQIVNEYRYLGVVLDCHGTNESLMNHLCGATSRALGSVISKTKANYDLGYKTFTKLLESCVFPIVDYASGSWSTGSNCLRIDSIQARATRFYCGLPRNTTLMALHHETNWSPGVIRRDLEKLRLYNQLVRMERGQLSRRLLEYDRLVEGTWSADMKALCETLGLVEAWNEFAPVNLKFARKTLDSIFRNAWKAEVSTKPKLSLMAKLNGDCAHNTPHYVSSNLKKCQRSLISRLWTGSLQLRIETGRYYGIPRAERHCQVCNNDCVEDELHFLFDCERYNSARIKLYSKLPELISESNYYKRFDMLCNAPYVCGKYVEEIWNMRLQSLS